MKFHLLILCQSFFCSNLHNEGLGEKGAAVGKGCWRPWLYYSWSREERGKS